MSSTPLTCCSIGVATVCETSWALAPGYMQVTETGGGAIGGYRAIGSENSAMPPASVMTIERTDAKIGRSMKKRENTRRISRAAYGAGASAVRRGEPQT